MSGYKRVNFYELCRLCASNQQKEKTHIFQEEGRKIQLQNKIQICLSLKVCENDFLPKVVCSQCLHVLEVCYTFRNECVSSETMLSSYFNNFRYTEDFKKSGKVYIKDTSGANKVQPKESKSQNFEFITVPNGTNQNNVDDSENNRQDKSLAYNLSTINFAALKGIVQNIPKNEQVNNIAVSSSGEIMNLTPLIDLESILVQNQQQKVKQICKSNNKKGKIDKNDNDLNADLKRHIQDRYEKLPHIKSMQTNKYAYAIKIEESNKDGEGGSAVVVNQISNVNIPLNGTHNNFTSNYSTIQSVSNSTISQSNVGNWNFTSPLNNNINLVNGNLNNNQTMFNQTSQNWNLVATSSSNTTAIEQNDKMIQQHQNIQLPQENRQNVLNNNRNNDIQTVDISPLKTEQPIKTFECEFCSKSFKRREHLYQHLKLHTGLRPYSCENCKKSFMRKEHLMRHLTSHTGQKNFTCNICEKSFSRNDNLLKHKKTHEKQTNFVCEVCNKQFVMKHYYLAHKVGHENSDKCQFWNILKT